MRHRAMHVGPRGVALFLCAAAALLLAAVPADAQSMRSRATRAASAPADCGAGPVAGDRVAVLIGNSRYGGAGWPRLPNAENDITAVCTALRSAGYAVRVIRNADFAGLQTALADFSAAAGAAHSVIIYYAGHGFEYSGSNYIVPVGAPNATSRRDIEQNYVSIEALVDQLVPQGAFGLLFIDACRTADPVVTLLDPDPRATSGAVRTMGLLNIAEGAVLFSTARGRPAFDAAPAGSPNSPFAAALVRQIATPGIELTQMFRAVTSDVVARTRSIDNGPQRPFNYGSTTEAFYLIPPSDVRYVPPPVASAVRPAGNVTAPVPPRRTDRRIARPARPSTRAPAGLVADPMAPLGLPLDRLAVEDEPALVAELLSRRPVSDIAMQAQAGVPVAQYLLGYMYEFGVGVRRDLVLARGWLANAAKDDFAPGQLEYGYFLLNHGTGPDDRQRAERLYRAAAGSGYAKAQSHLAYQLSIGTFGPPDFAAARELYLAAANAGHAASMFALTTYPDLRPQMIARLRNLADNGNAEGNAWICEAGYAAQAVQPVAQDCLIGAQAGFAGPRAILAHCAQSGACGTPASADDARFWARLARGQPELRDDLRQLIATIAP